ncbi:MAG: ABC transporter permease [Legionellales bacterium]|nr:ABC transporter permease [Legionellales bacterium]
MNLKSEITSFWREIYQKKYLLKVIVNRDFKKMYAGTYFGVVWVFLQPLIYICVIYAVFTFGIRASFRGNVPFVSYLLTGMIPWMFFSELLNSASSTIKQHGYLIKNASIRISILPIVKIISHSISHVILISIAILVVVLNGKPITIYSFQLVYYFFAMNLLLFGTILILSSIGLFIPDTANIIKIITQFGFWLTPIIWDISKLPTKFHWLVHLNPLGYIISGYRDSLLYENSIAINLWQAIYYWSFTLVICIIGIAVFRRLRPHFAEVV